jgi:putative N6-adenine-specific DNA methylase
LKQNKKSLQIANIDQSLVITLKTFFGLEEALIQELEELGYKNPQRLNRAVQIKGEWRDVYYLNLHVRCAISILVQVASFDIRDEDDLYKQAMQIRWDELFSIDKTFAIRGAVHSDVFRHSQYPFLLVKDAIVDCFRKYTDDRPNVNTKTPQIVIDVYIQHKHVTLSLNTSGAPLFQRGYRQDVGEAPLNEVVAAAMIRLSGWDRKSTFIDPLCGSGTLLIEAALLAAGIPSCIERHHFAFRNLKLFNPIAWEEIRSAVPMRVSQLPCRIMGSDIRDDMILKTRRNLRQLNIGRFVETTSTPFQQVKKPDGESGLIITNPPYGERLKDDIPTLYAELGSWLKHEMSGYHCWIISSSEEGFTEMGLRHTKKWRLFNGDIECSYRGYELYDGSKKRKE